MIVWHTYLQDFIHQTPACSSHLLVSHPLHSLSLSLPSPTPPPLSPSLSLDVLVPASLFVEERVFTLSSRGLGLSCRD